MIHVFFLKERRTQVFTLRCTETCWGCHMYTPFLFFRRFTMACCCTALLLLALGPAIGVAAQGKANAAPPATGMLRITSQRSGEMPPARFPHDAHAKTLGSASCATCHTQTEAGKASLPEAFSFKGTNELSGLQRKAMFHAACLGCHTQRTSQGLVSGPSEAQCRSCHARPEQGETATVFRPRLDKALHYRHIQSSAIPAPEGVGQQANCKACHHPVPSMPESPPYQSCGTCHADTPKEKQPSLRVAAHISCFGCHAATQAKGNPSGPITCAGCHNEVVWQGYSRPANVPLLLVNQPVVRLMQMPQPAKPEGDQAEKQPTAAMQPVLFNHSLHEKALPSCASCHHKTLQACTTCHTMEGSEKGGMVPLTQAMHGANSVRSCVGCHTQRSVTLPACTPCHGQAPRTIAPQCGFCHKQPDAAGQMPPPAGEPMNPATQRIPATPFQGDYGQEQKQPWQLAPEVVTIGALSNEYEASTFPHGAVIRGILARINAAAPSMADKHKEGYTLCMGCHHNSPASANPPRCISCHQPGDGSIEAVPQGGKPLLKAAYHLQCMGCHTQMRVEKPANTDCAGCHAVKVGAKK